MATFDYTAKDTNGNVLAGTYDDIKSVSLLRRELEKMGYILIKARRQKQIKQRRKRIKSSEVVTFIYKFSEMYTAGLSITRALEVLEEQTKNPSFALVIADIKQNIENGLSLQASFAKHTNVFSKFFSGMLEAGESGGNLSKVLEMSAEYLEKQMDMRRKIKTALTYPAVVGSVSLIVISSLIIFVVPIFAKLYSQLHIQLPGPTQTLLIISLLLRNYWWLIPFVIAAVTTIFIRILKRPDFKAKWDAFKLKMPVFGDVNRMIIVSHFTRTFGMLTSVGISPIRALDVASLVAHNHKLSKISKQLQDTIERGHGIGESFKKYDIFPSMIIQLAISGEEVGQVSQMLMKGADFLDKDIDRSIGSFVIKLEPVLTVIMGTIIGFILLAVYLPMFDYMRHLQ